MLKTNLNGTNLWYGMKLPHARKLLKHLEKQLWSSEDVNVDDLPIAEAVRVTGQQVNNKF